MFAHIPSDHASHRVLVENSKIGSACSNSLSNYSSYLQDMSAVNFDSVSRMGRRIHVPTQ